MKKTVYHKYINLLRLCLVVAVFLLTFSVNKLTVSASDQIEYTSLPYKVQNRLNYDLSVYANAYNSLWGNPSIIGTSQYVVDWDNPNILAWSIIDGNEVWNHFMLPMNSNPYGDYYSVDLNGYPYATFDTTQNYLSIQFDPGYWYHTIIVERTDGRIDAYGFDNTQAGMRISFFSTFTPPSFLNGGVYYWNSLDSQAPVLYVNTNDLIEPGDPVQPDFDDPSLPNKPTKPTIPSPPSKPTINDISDLAAYIGDLIIWLGSDVITPLLDYFADLVSFYLASILSAIKKGFDFIFQNIVNFLKPFLENFVSLLNNIKELLKIISDFFEKLIEIGLDENGNFSLSTFFHNLLVPSSQDLSSLLSNSDDIGVINFFDACENKLESFFNNITNLTPNYRIYVPVSSWHNTTIGGFYIDFSWYQDYKVYCDLVISGFLIIGYLYWLYVSVNGFLRGQKLDDVTEKEKGK